MANFHSQRFVLVDRWALTVLSLHSTYRGALKVSLPQDHIFELHPDSRPPEIGEQLSNTATELKVKFKSLILRK